METVSLNFTNLTRVLNEYAESMLDESKSAMPDDWALKEKISFNVESSKGIYSVVFNAPEYWKYANYGRGPGKMPPIDAIQSWIEVRKIVPSARNNKVPSTRSLAFLIARKIAREGTKGVPFLETAISITEDEFKERIADAITLDIAESIDILVKPYNGTVSI